jgi:hypothetical protein
MELEYIVGIVVSVLILGYLLYARAIERAQKSPNAIPGKEGVLGFSRWWDGAISDHHDAGFGVGCRGPLFVHFSLFRSS